MRNKLNFSILTLLFISIFSTSCSLMLEDFKNCTKDSKYKVEHYQEVVAEYKKTDSGYEQTNLKSLDDGTVEIVYSLIDSEELQGQPGNMTQAAAKSYNGFTALSFDQKEITEDDSCVIKIFYNRNEVTVTVSIGDGIWNYVQKKEDDSIEEDITDRVFTKKYGSSTVEDFDSLFTYSGKQGYSLTKFNVSDNTEVAVLPDEYPYENKTYTAVWEEGKPVNYKVVHHFEKVECTDSSIESSENYDIRTDLTITKQGIPELETETQDCVVNVPGFTVKPHSEKEISSNGSTVIDLYYIRNPYYVEISTDDGMWNYDEWKADKSNVVQNTSPKKYDGKYGSLIDWTFLKTLKKTGMNLTGLIDDSTGEVIVLSKLPQSIPAVNTTYTAQWSRKDLVSYEIRFMTEKVDSEDSDDIKNYIVHSSDSSQTGVPEYYTAAEPKEIPGFTAKDIVQEEIKEDGSTVVYVYYIRNTYKITFDLSGGYWNYLSYRDDKSLTPDTASKELSGKFEAFVDFPDFSEIGKRANDFIGWKNSVDHKTYTNDEISEILEKFDCKNIVLQAQWEKGNGYEYTVEHWFEKVDSRDSTNIDNFEIQNDLSQIEVGEEIGDDTEAVAKTVAGFTAEPFVQMPILADGKTVIKIYYTRNSSRFIFDSNGGEITDGESEITGLYEAGFDFELTPKAKKTGWTFGGWTYKGKLVSNSDLQLENQSFDIEDKTFVAYWVSTISVKSTTIFGDVFLIKEQDSSKVTCYLQLPSGYDDSDAWSYKWYLDGVYTSNEAVFTRTPEILGKGVHTITIKATMNGQNFTQRVTVTIE